MPYQHLRPSSEQEHTFISYSTDKDYLINETRRKPTTMIPYSLRQVNFTLKMPGGNAAKPRGHTSSDKAESFMTIIHPLYLSYPPLSSSLHPGLSQTDHLA